MNVESQRVEAGRIEDTAVMPQAAAVIEHRHLQPAVVGLEAGGPDDGANAAGAEIESQ